MGHYINDVVVKELITVSLRMPSPRLYTYMLMIACSGVALVLA